MAKRFTRNIKNIKDIEKQPKNTNEQNDLLSDDKHVYVRNKDQYEKITGGVKEVNGETPDENGHVNLQLKDFTGQEKFVRKNQLDKALEDIESGYQQYTDNKVSSSEKKTNNTINGIQASGENLIQNGNFENGFTGWNPDASASLVNNERTSGKALRMKKGGTELMTSIPVEPERTYEFGYWYRTSSDFDGDTQNTKMRLGAPNGALVDSESYNGNTTEWKKLAKTTKIKSKDIYSLKISIKSEGSKGWIDFSELYLIDITRYNETEISAKKYTDSQIKSFVDGNVELSGYATENYVDEAIDGIKTPEQPDLSGYATEDYVNQAIDEKAPDLSDYAKKQDVNTLKESLPKFENEDLVMTDTFENAFPDRKSTRLQYVLQGNMMQIFGLIKTKKELKGKATHVVAKLPDKFSPIIEGYNYGTMGSRFHFKTYINEKNDSVYPNEITIRRITDVDNQYVDLAADEDGVFHISLTIGVELNG